MKNSEQLLQNLNRNYEGNRPKVKAMMKMIVAIDDSLPKSILIK